ncbi:pseudouridylate synthase RPUSD2-like isoform X1 [Zophobas morio]|uniref:pseudouridylate synthase RPUSD2-like isoform X1 n=1 Tax=Zophobas morio TaxID=2755281 RepID=UPI0030832AFB
MLKLAINTFTIRYQNHCFVEKFVRRFGVLRMSIVSSVIARDRVFNNLHIAKIKRKRFDFKNIQLCTSGELTAMDQDQEQRGGSANYAVNQGYVSVCTQCGDWLTVDEENIVVMVKSYSPARDVDTQNEENKLDFHSDEASTICGGEKDKGKLTGTEKRKADDGEPNKDLKKAKLETKALKAKRPGFTDDRYNETSYYIENGLRKVYPYYFTFTTFTKGRWVGERILDVFAREFRAHPAEEYERCIQAGTLTVNYDKVPTDYKLKHNDLLANVVHRHEVPVTSQPITIVHMDEDIVVVNKPASIPVHPCGRYRHNTVVFILAKEYNLKNLRTIHRLDRLTSGLLLFGRSPKKARQMEHQIRNRLVQKEYVCRVEGEFPDEIIECKEPIEVVSYKIGVCKVSPKGKDCNTIFQKLGYNGKTSIVLCKPKTGRMHQIRVHLQYLGYPVVNDPLYNHEVFGPMKGKGGDLGGKSDEELVRDLIHIHNAENWLGMDGDSELSMFNPRKADLDDSLVGPLVPKDRVLGDDDADPVSREPSPCDESCDNNSSIPCESSPHPLALSSLTTSRNVDAKVTVATQTGHEAPDFSFNPDKMTVDKHCYECKVRYRDPKPQDLVMYLHAWKYRGPGWEFETELPDWARVDWVDPDISE